MSEELGFALCFSLRYIFVIVYILSIAISEKKE